MRSAFRIAALALGALAGGCAATPRPAPVDVTRFHLGRPMELTTVSVEPMAGNQSVGLEYQSYADAVAAELARVGYVRASSERPAAYVAGIAFVRRSLGQVRKRPPVTIGIGGGSFGGNVGVGGGASFGIGGGRAEVTGTELQVQLRRRSDDTIVWEGRATTEAVGDQPGATAQRLAAALFRDFPGESGITISVP